MAKMQLGDTPADGYALINAHDGGIGRVTAYYCQSSDGVYQWHANMISPRGEAIDHDGSRCEDYRGLSADALDDLARNMRAAAKRVADLARALRDPSLCES